MATEGTCDDAAAGDRDPGRCSLAAGSIAAAGTQLYNDGAVGPGHQHPGGGGGLSHARAILYLQRAHSAPPSARHVSGNGEAQLPVPAGQFDAERAREGEPWMSTGARPPNPGASRLAEQMGAPQPGPAPRHICSFVLPHGLTVATS